MQMQMLRLLDGSEDSPVLGRKQETPPEMVWINREQRLQNSSELRHQQSFR
ncbi:hypothetical protein I553_9655 [Mycobacterium xenopi 4042]|uniref:Uncharacterized protein n=2 Tax=Mycobacterium xenopi TaxID=1789 RepID=A0AAD1M0C4_MYCXE|nr:hypothetical protein I553_9655 [Mycobacterium xenopi 4042]BBU21833.1 hypothetical protein MYXE_16220 [Mycobacterium xenopi]SPX93642.1 Uncharacterised protein [Mycobacterium xenopi]